MKAPLSAAVRLLLYVLWSLVVVPPQIIILRWARRWRHVMPMLYHRGCARLAGIRVRMVGCPSPARPTLFVCNHVSYLDIPVLGSILTGSFIAKSEVSGWPGFGFLSQMQETVFIARGERQQAGHQVDELRHRLERGDNLILFPEGTSSDGTHTLPFKSSLFAIAALTSNGQPITVQPVSLTATALDGLPMGRCYRPFYAWFGDMDLVPHLWRFFNLGTVEITVEFHPPATLPGAGSRKALAQYCQKQVAMGVSQALAGRVGAGG